MKTRIEVLPPTVIPAQPGFRSVSMFLDQPATSKTTPTDIVLFYEPIIAWMIRPILEHRDQESADLGEPEVVPVLITGEHFERDFIVDQTGQWSRRGRVYKSESEAREAWLSEERQA